MIKFLVEKRKITLLVFIMLIIYGAFSFTKLPMQYMPDVVIKAAVVTTIYPGATPEKIEQSVTKVLEQSIRKVEGVESVLSTSASDVSIITVLAYDNADAEETWSDLRTKVQDVVSQLPEDAQEPVVNDDLASTFLGTYVIYADTREQLYELHETMIQWSDQLKIVPGVADVKIKGIPDKEVRINIDPQKLQAYGVPWEQVLSSVQNAVNRLPLGDLNYNERNYQLLIREIEDSNELNDVLIAKSQAGFPIYLRDIGQSTISHMDEDFLAYYDGSPAITINVTSIVGADIPVIDKNVNEKFDELVANLPDDVVFTPTFKQVDIVNEMLGHLSKEMIIAIFAVILVCVLGLHYLTAFFVALAIPISIAVGLIFVELAGITMNEISFVGLIIVLGILVDDAIVVNDNIERRLRVLGESPKVASIEGAREVSVSILTATLSTIFAFTPLLFLTGDVGAFIRPIPIVIAFTMLASMAMSLTIIPIFRQWYEERRQSKQINNNNNMPDGILGKQIKAVTQWYARKLLPKLLKNPLRTALIGLLIGTLSFSLALITPIELFPEAEDPYVNINVQLPVGTSMDRLDEIVQEMAKWVMEQPETEKVSAAAAGEAPELFSVLVPNSSNATSGQIAVIGKEDVFDLNTTVDRWKNELQSIFPQVTIVMDVPRLGVPVGSAVSIRLEGDELDELQELAQQVKGIVAETEGTTGIRDNFGIQRYTLEFQLNKQAMDQYMIDYQSVTRALRLINSGIKISNFNTGDEIIDINLYFQSDSQDPNLIFQQVNVTNAMGQQIPITQIAEMKPTFSIQQIHHDNMKRAVTVEANVTDRTATEVNNEIRAKLQGMNFPAGYSWEFGGEVYEQADIFADLANLFIIVIFLIFILITIQFYSLSAPIIVMTTVYLAAGGGVIGIFVSGSSIGFMSIMGIISLAGIVVRNGIVLIEFIEDARRHRGLELKEAVIEAASARFRPILLTSLAAILGILPLALGNSILFHPMAYTIIFGLMVSTFLTLLVVPSLYMVVAQLKLKRQERKQNTSYDNNISI
jgi:multidrug efflux pump subunit AcrB